MLSILSLNHWHTTWPTYDMLYSEWFGEFSTIADWLADNDNNLCDNTPH